MSVPDEQLTTRLRATALRKNMFIPCRVADLRVDLLVGITVGSGVVFLLNEQQ